MKTKKMVYAGLLLSIGVILPQAFHVFGQSVGGIFLPIHIPVLIAGLLLGPYYGAVIGLFVPILSSLLTGMPPIPKLYFMLFELVAYGFFMGIFIKKYNVYITLVLSMMLGRICYGLSLAITVELFGIEIPFANQTAFIGGIITGIPGIMIQVVLIPILYLTIIKGGHLLEDAIESSN